MPRFRYGYLATGNYIFANSGFVPSYRIFVWDPTKLYAAFVFTTHRRSPS